MMISRKVDCRYLLHHIRTQTSSHPPFARSGLPRTARWRPAKYHPRATHDHILGTPSTSGISQLGHDYIGHTGDIWFCRRVAGLPVRRSMTPLCTVRKPRSLSKGCFQAPPLLLGCFRSLPSSYSRKEAKKPTFAKSSPIFLGNFELLQSNRAVFSANRWLQTIIFLSTLSIPCSSMESSHQQIILLHAHFIIVQLICISANIRRNGRCFLVREIRQKWFWPASLSLISYPQV